MARLKKRVGGRGRKMIYSLALALISVFFIAYAVQTIYPSPQWDAYCGKVPVPVEIRTEKQCLELDGNWTTLTEKNPDNVTGYCDMYSKCQQAFDDKRIPYERNVFIDYICFFSVWMRDGPSQNIIKTGQNSISSPRKNSD